MLLLLHAPAYVAEQASNLKILQKKSFLLNTPRSAQLLLIGNNIKLRLC